MKHLLWCLLLAGCTAAPPMAPVFREEGEPPATPWECPVVYVDTLYVEIAPGVWGYFLEPKRNCRA